MFANGMQNIVIFIYEWIYDTYRVPNHCKDWMVDQKHSIDFFAQDIWPPGNLYCEYICLYTKLHTQIALYGAWTWFHSKNTITLVW